MLPFWILAILLVTGTFANQDSGKFQIIFFYRLRQFMVDAFGEGGNRIAPGCKSPCDMEAFLKEVSNVTKGVLKEPDRKTLIRGPNGERIDTFNPDYRKGDFSQLTDEHLKDLGAAGKELDKLGFKGAVLNGKLFKGWSGTDTFTEVMSYAKSAIDDTRHELHRQGKDPNGGHFNEIKKSLQATADSRRMNHAGALRGAFKEDMGQLVTDLKLILTAPISHPPIPDYQQVDVEETIRENADKNGMDNHEEKLRRYVDEYNKGGGQSSRHAAIILEAQGLHDELELPFGSCK